MKYDDQMLLTGNCIYGIGPPGLQTTLRKDGVFVELAEAEAMHRRFLSAKPGLVAGIHRDEALLKQHGYLTSFTGRVRRIPEVFSADASLVGRACRQGINFPIQSGAADMTLAAMVIIWREMRRRGMRSLCILTVHDSLVFDAHVDEVFELARLVLDVMQNLPKYAAEVLPGVDWSWITVPIISELEMGITWGDGIAFDPDEVEYGTGGEGPAWEMKNGKFDCRKPKSIDELWDVMLAKASCN